ncbi:SOS response-associated peptidase family protein [Edaphobacter modestus]|uniref:SOS response associated peptidase (SRAP) n=1 Tax=Edaphobacter modestus TaxID=388466 RepID=A0A4Q7YQN7_9BACT|nr:hypothetical protein BDD14_1173 [Edaphobacter modestus]
MCGRYGRRSDKQKIAEHFRAKPEPAELPVPDADYNIAPTTFQPIITSSGNRINTENGVIGDSKNTAQIAPRHYEQLSLRHA